MLSVTTGDRLGLTWELGPSFLGHPVAALALFLASFLPPRSFSSSTRHFSIFSGNYAPFRGSVNVPVRVSEWQFLLELMQASHTPLPVMYPTAGI